MCRTKNVSTLTVILASLYTVLLIWLILFKMSNPAQIFLAERVRNINLIPFYYDIERSFHTREVIENLLIFIPLGLYFRMLKIKGGYAILIGMGFSLLMETLQYAFGIGAADITDFITNTLGTAIGVSLYALLLLPFKDRDKLNQALNVVALVCTVLFIGFTVFLFMVNFA